MTDQALIDHGSFGWTQHPNSIFNEEKMQKDAYNTEQGRHDRGLTVSSALLLTSQS